MALSYRLRERQIGIATRLHVAATVVFFDFWTPSKTRAMGGWVVCTVHYKAKTKRYNNARGVGELGALDPPEERHERGLVEGEESRLFVLYKDVCAWRGWV